MTTFDVLVQVDGNPDFQTQVQAPDEWKARTRVMAIYPHRLAGALVNYTVTEVKP